ncbi:MAG: hypothetical protein IJ619_03145, partial [Eubacterium sp.]|nr:hypothetical protein [Eubacterium sp.]
LNKAEIENVKKKEDSNNESIMEKRLHFTKPVKEDSETVAYSGLQNLAANEKRDDNKRKQSDYNSNVLSIILIYVAVILAATVLVFVVLLRDRNKDKNTTEAYTVSYAEDKTERVSEATTEQTEITTTEAVSEKKTEVTTESTEEKTEVTEEEKTKDTVVYSATSSGGYTFESPRGAAFYVPEGFENVSPEMSAVRYCHVFYNSELDMNIQVVDAMRFDIPMNVDEEYAYYKNYLENTPGNTFVYEFRDDGVYVLSGYIEGGSEVVYYKSRYFGDRYVQIIFTYSVKYKDSCDQVLVDFLDRFEYGD